MKKETLEKEIAGIFSMIESKSRLMKIFERLQVDELSDDELIAYDILVVIENSESKTELEKVKAISQILSGIKKEVVVDTTELSLKKQGEKFIDELFASLEQKTDEVKYPNVIFFIKGNNVLAEYNTKNKTFYYDYYQIWLILKDNFKYTYDDCQKLIQNKVEEHFNLKSLITGLTHIKYRSLMDEHSNLKPNIDKEKNHQTTIKSDSLKEQGEKFIDELFASLEQKVDEVKYPNYIFFFKEKKVLAEYDTKNKVFYYHYNKIWLVLKDNFKYTYDDCQELIKNNVEEHFNLKPSTTIIFFFKEKEVVEEHFNLEPNNDNKKVQQTQIESESLKEQGEKFIDELFASLEQKVDAVKYPNYIFFFKEKKVLAKYDTINKAFYSHYSDIWLILKNNFNYTYDDYQELIKNKVEEHFNLKPSTTQSNSFFLIKMVEEHFNIKPINDNKKVDQTKIKSESLKKKGEKYIDELFDSLEQKVDDIKYPERVFFFKDKNVIVDYNTKTNVLYYNSSYIWLILKDNFKYTYDKCKVLINNKVEEHFNLKPSTTGLNSDALQLRIEEHFNLISNTDNKKVSLTTIETNSLKEQGEKFIDDLFSSLEQKVDEVKFPNEILFFKQNKLKVLYDTKYKVFYYHYSDIWLILEDVYKYKISKCQTLIKSMAKKHFNFDPVKIERLDIKSPNSTEDHFNSKTSTTSSEEKTLKKQGEQFIDDLFSSLEQKKYEQYPDIIFFFKEKEVVAKYDIKNKVFYYHRVHIRLNLQNNFEYTYDDYQELIKNKVEEHFNLKPLTTLL